MPILRNPTRAQKLAEWRAQLRLRIILGRRVRPKIQKEFNRIAKEAARSYEEGGETVLDLVLENHAKRIKSILGEHWRRTWLTFGKRFENAAKAFPQFETKDDKDFFEMLMARWIEEEGSKKVVRISRTTKTQINLAIERGLSEGENIFTIAKRIKAKTGGTIARARSIIIARTETHSASMEASNGMAETLQIDSKMREWIAVGDDRTRSSHVDADGQKRLFGDFFDVGGHKLEFPGDPGGPPEEIIQCRCVTAIVLEGEE